MQVEERSDGVWLKPQEGRVGRALGPFTAAEVDLLAQQAATAKGCEEGDVQTSNIIFQLGPVAVVQRDGGFQVSLGARHITTRTEASARDYASAIFSYLQGRSRALTVAADTPAENLSPASGALKYDVGKLAQIIVSIAVAKRHAQHAFPPAEIQGSWEEVEKKTKVRSDAMERAASATLQYFNALDQAERFADMVASFRKEDRYTSSHQMVSRALKEVPSKMEAVVEAEWQKERKRLEDQLETLTPDAGTKEQDAPKGIGWRLRSWFAKRRPAGC